MMETMFMRSKLLELKIINSIIAAGDILPSPAGQATSEQKGMELWGPLFLIGCLKCGR